MRPSIRRRLLVLTAGVTTGVVGVAAAFIGWRMERSLRQGLDQTLRAEAAALASRVETENGKIEFDLDPAALARAGLGGHVLVRIVGPNDASIYASPQLTDSAARRDWPPRGRNSGPTDWFDIALPPTSEPYRVIALRTQPVESEDSAAPRSARTAQHVWVFVAEPLAPLLATLRQLDWTLAMTVLLAVGASLVGGLFVARSGTRPIAVVADLIAHVEPGRPRLKVDRACVPRELDPMVSKTELLLGRIDQELSRQRQLTADMAHDLRTPLAGVKTVLDVCIQHERTATEYVDAIRAAQHGLRQLNLSLDNILTLARLDADAERPPLSRIRIADVIADATATVASLASARNVEIRCVSDSRVEAVSNQTMLAKILTNLLANAVEYCPTGSPVTIGVDRANERVSIEVCNTGPGIPAEQRERIFDRFVRGDESRATGGGHNGLGLPIARGLARLLGGDVRLDTAADQRVEFVVELPAPAD